MNSIDKVIEIISKRLTAIEKDLREDVADDYKKHLEIERTVFRRLKDLFEWESLTVVERQASRLAILVSMRKTGAKESIISVQESAINIYGLINLSLPYIKVVNVNNMLNLLESLCKKEIEIIDSSGSSFRGSHVSADEIEAAFRTYFENVKPYKMDMFRECYEKIEVLYQVFKSLPRS